MPVTIELPTNIQRHLESTWGDHLERKATEAIAAEGYRTGDLSTGEVAEMLGISINDADGFLKERGLMSIDRLDDVENDDAALERVLNR